MVLDCAGAERRTPQEPKTPRDRCCRFNGWPRGHAELKAGLLGDVGSTSGREAADPRAKLIREDRHREVRLVVGAPGQLKRLGTDAFTASAACRIHSRGC